ncbi:LicD family protein [Streptococcus ruminantium]|uniref:LicD family protein n=1 Tax=Streptococcus ruminantium TaxID=1917441 RepID=UPI0012DF960B|nr:LicD family protein [Streptococcus ruminantium]
MNYRKELTIRENQLIALAILDTISEICEKLNLRYNLMYGTLIGAIRHKALIPWDDDIDIMMPQKDYKLLLEFLEKNIASFPHLKVFNPDTVPEYPYMITRISDIRYIINIENEKEYGLGAFIDIYPFYGLGDTEEEAISIGMKGDRLSSACYQSTRISYKVENTKKLYRKVLKYPAFWIAKIIGKEYFQKKLVQLAQRKEYDESKYVGCVVWLSGGKKDIFLKEWFDESISVTMEGRNYNVPARYDEILTHIYGDYMELPAEKDRVAHHRYKIYRK